MADITALENRIRSLIRTNGNQEITGAVAQQILLDIADSLNAYLETEVQARQQAIQEERQRAEASFDDLNMVDVAGSELQKTQITLVLRKNDGSEQEPNWRTLSELVIPSAAAQRAGLLPAKSEWDNKPIYESDNIVGSGAIYKELATLDSYIGGLLYPEKYLLANGVWYDVNSKHLCINIKGGDVIVFNFSTTSYYTLLKTYVKPTYQNQPISSSDFATGYSDRIVRAANTDFTITAPEDANYLYIAGDKSILNKLVVNGVSLLDNINSRIYELNSQERQRAEASFDDLNMVDVAGSELQKTQITLVLRKNDGSEQEPNWRTLSELVIPSAAAQRAGLLPAKSEWDNKPIYESDNIVGSGAIYKELATLDSYIGGLLYPEKYLLANGVWYDVTKKHLCINIKGGDVILFNFSTASYYTLLKTYVKPTYQNQPISSSDFATGYSDRILRAANTDFTITAPEDANYLYIAGDKSILNKLVVNGMSLLDNINSRIYRSQKQEEQARQQADTLLLQKHNTLEEDYKGVKVTLESKGVLDILFDVVGGINADGSDSGNLDNIRTDYIPVNEGSRLSYDVRLGSLGWCAIACYDENGDFMDSVSLLGTHSGEFIIPENVAQIRLSSLSSYSNAYARFEQKTDIEHLSDDVTAYFNRIINFETDGGVGYANGQIAYTAGTERKLTKFIRVFSGEKITYDVLAGSSGWCAVAAFDESFNYVKSSSIAGNSSPTTPSKGTYVVPEGVTYIILTGLATYSNKAEFEKPLTNTELEQIDFIVTGNISFNVNGGINADGSDSGSSDYIRTDYIPVSENDVIIASVKLGSSGWCALACYDSSKAFVSNASILGGAGTVLSINKVIPSGISYIRLSSQVLYKGTKAKKELQSTPEIKINSVSFLKYPNILKQRACFAIQMDLGNLDDSVSGYKEMLATLREYGLMSMDYAINITALQNDNIAWLNKVQEEGCEIIYHNRINSPSDVSANSQLTVEQAKAGVCAERLAMSQKGFTTFGLVANNGSVGSQFKPMLDNLMFYTIYGSAQILTSWNETTKEYYQTNQRVIRTGFDMLHSEHSQEAETQMINRGKDWIDSLITNHSMGVMYCHYYNRPDVDDYGLYEGVLRGIAEYIVEKINSGELYYGSTTECLNYLCR